MKTSKVSRRVTALAALLFTGTATFGGNKVRPPQEPGAELRKAPRAASSWRNPYGGQADAVLAGKKLFGKHCVSCHGEDAAGIDKAPSLRSPVMRSATAGVLLWFLKNGNRREGMPSWSKLPDQQLWQLVAYLQSLGSEGSASQ
ncbi:MAG: cytochrome c [Acidobacteria bacterium]|nr:cytochrome c [Acidobacteriota bacterium]